jgi:hypothetical protein
MRDREEVILQALRTGEFLLSVHAAERMRQRAVTKSDIEACGSTATSCLQQPERGTFRVDGKDLDGEPLAVICAANDAVIIVTLF